MRREHCSTKRERGYEKRRARRASRRLWNVAETDARDRTTGFGASLSHRHRGRSAKRGSGDKALKIRTRTASRAESPDSGHGRGHAARYPSLRGRSLRETSGSRPSSRTPGASARHGPGDSSTATPARSRAAPAEGREAQASVLRLFSGRNPPPRRRSDPGARRRHRPGPPGGRRDTPPS